MRDHFLANSEVIAYMSEKVHNQITGVSGASNAITRGDICRKGIWQEMYHKNFIISGEQLSLFFSCSMCILNHLHKSSVISTSSYNSESVIIIIKTSILHQEVWINEKRRNTEEIVCYLFQLNVVITAAIVGCDPGPWERLWPQDSCNCRTMTQNPPRHRAAHHLAILNSANMEKYGLYVLLFLFSCGKILAQTGMFIRFVFITLSDV